MAIVLLKRKLIPCIGILMVGYDINQRPLKSGFAAKYLL